MGVQLLSFPFFFEKWWWRSYALSRGKKNVAEVESGVEAVTAEERRRVFSLKESPLVQGVSVRTLSCVMTVCRVLGAGLRL